ncbi:hypothetical protein DSO57_1027374 [Entomophthora muscae]|uniref:Uncharacterized protein n=1 Tax=Entomophthora muscae TaxID=34485 RepID=A0ACC2RGL7_9FUNG|nr:hypothetical protein DSO57_1027374 [Entomophthora muscae]
MPSEDSCEAFLHLTSCRTLPAKEFALKEGISVFAIPKESNIYRQLDDILNSELLKDIIFNRRHYACAPFKTAASVEQGDNVYIMLSPFGDDDVNGYRPVDFPGPSCKIKGMEPYAVPATYSPEVRELYHRLNIDLTMRDIKPFMFSSLLSNYTGTDLATKLLCSSFADAACLSDAESILSPPSTMSLLFQRSSNTLAQLLESPQIPGTGRWPSGRFMAILAGPGDPNQPNTYQL